MASQGSHMEQVSLQVGHKSQETTSRGKTLGVFQTERRARTQVQKLRNFHGLKKDQRACRTVAKPQEDLGERQGVAICVRPESRSRVSHPVQKY